MLREAPRACGSEMIGFDVIKTLCRRLKFFMPTEDISAACICEVQCADSLAVYHGSTFPLKRCRIDTDEDGDRRSKFAVISASTLAIKGTTCFTPHGSPALCEEIAPVFFQRMQGLLQSSVQYLCNEIPDSNYVHN